MTENKRFKNVEEKLYWGTVQYFTYNDEKITDEEIEKLVNHLLNQTEQLKSKNRGLQSELQIFKEDITHSNLQMNKLADENEQLRKDATILIYANQDYRQQNQNLQKQLDYIQNSINEHIKHQKTELGQKALREVIQDYNDWLLGHKEVKE